MSIPVAPAVLGVVTGVLVLAGVINGLAGFGFALVGTMTLAAAFDPATAVVFMIVPILAVNGSLVAELTPTEVRSCGRRFAPLILAALVGTLIGLVVLEQLPAAPLRVGLGVVTVAFVANFQQRVPIPGRSAVRSWCFVDTPAAMVGVGGVSGLLFGGSNVGVQLVAYVRSFDLTHGMFIGVVAMVFLGLNAVRVVAAGVLGLYSDLVVFGGSIAAVVPAVAGVVVGRRIRASVADATRRLVVLGLLTVIGVRLLVAGAGII